MKNKIIFCLFAVILLTSLFFYYFKLYRAGSPTGLVATALAPGDCPPPPKRNWDSSFYQGPLIDTHIHIASIPEEPENFDKNGDHPVMGYNLKIADYVCMMDYENTKKVFAFFPVWDPITAESLEIVKTTMAKHGDRFVPFIMPPDHDNDISGFPTVSAEALKKMLNVYPGLFQGYGEIGLYARGDHGGPKGAPELPPDSPRLSAIYPIVRQHNLLVYFHLGEGHQASFERTLAANPDINFIWHGDQLIPYEQGGQNLKNIDDILSKHPNAYYGVDELYGDVWLLRPEVSQAKFLAHFKDYEPLLKKDLATWKSFIEKHPDQVLWGTDRGWSTAWSVDPDVALTLNNYSRAFIGRLTPAVQEKFAYKNAERLLQNR